MRSLRAAAEQIYVWFEEELWKLLVKSDKSFLKRVVCGSWTQLIALVDEFQCSPE